MDEQDVLIDYDAAYSQICHVCLSIDRTLVILVSYRELYHQIVGLCDLEPSSPLYLCWECVALLRKVALFKQKALKSQETLSREAYHVDAPKTLSSLIFSETVVTDSTEELVDEIYQNDIKDEPYGSDRESDNDSYEPTNHECSDFTESLSKKDDVHSEVDKNILKLRELRVFVEKLDKERHINVFDAKNELQHDKFEIETAENGEHKNNNTLEQTEDTKENVVSSETDIKLEQCKPQLPNILNPAKKNQIDKSKNKNKKKDSINLKKSQQRPLNTSSYYKLRKYYRVNERLKLINYRQLSPSEIDIWRERERNSDYYKNITGEKCEICISGLGPKETLNSHHKRLHQKNHQRKRKRCKYCPSSYDYQSDLDVHMLNHNRLKECSVCGYQCYSTHNIKQHVKQHSNNRVQCLLCDATFSQKSHYPAHYRKYHSLFICDYCGQEMSKKDDLVHHIQRKHMMQKCPHCEKEYRSYNSLRDHIQRLHRNDPSEKSYCVTCDKQFRNRYLFKMHLIHTSIHMKERGAVKPTYQCPDCPKRLSSQLLINRHRDFVHLQKRNFTCSYCGAEYMTKDKLSKHINRVHLGIKAPKNKICPHCQRGFSTNDVLINHMRLHTGEKPFVCALCDVSYTQQISLTLHNRKVHGLPK